jgi:hypothetical protein
LPKDAKPRLRLRIALRQIYEHGDPPHPIHLLRARSERPSRRAA